MRQAVLDLRLTTLRTAPGVRARDVDRLGALIRELPDRDLIRVNPYAFSAAHGLDSERAVELFVHATKADLFELAWNTVCPACGAVEHPHRTLATVDPDHFYCSLCHWPIPSNLDDRLEATFTVSPDLRRVSIDPFASLAEYYRRYISHSFRHAPAFTEYLRSRSLGHVFVAPGTTRTVTLDIAPAEQYRVFSFDVHAASFLIAPRRPRPAEEARVSVDVRDRALAPKKTNVPTGRVIVEIANRTAEKVGAILMRADMDTYHQVLDQHPCERSPYLTGKILLNNHTFRTVFRVQTLDDAMRLKVRSLAVLYASLDGAADLSRRAGDTPAYETVRAHARAIEQSVTSSRGSVVRNQGDEMLASFPTVADATRAAVRAVERLGRLQRSTLRARLALHEGPALAVASDQQVQWFGQTVSTAAKLPSLGTADLLVTDRALAKDDAPALLSAAGFTPQRPTLSVDGTDPPLLVHRYRAPRRP